MSALGRKSLFDDDDDPLFSSSTFSPSSSSSSSSSATISSSSSSYKNGGLFDDETENDTRGVGVDPLKVEEPAVAAAAPPQPSSGGSALRGVDPSKVKLKAAKVESVTRGSGKDVTETKGSKLDTNTRMGLGVDFSDRLHAEQQSASGDSGSASSLSFLDDLLTAEDSKAFEATTTMKSSTSGLPGGDIPATTTPAFTGTDPASVVERKTNLLLDGDEDADADDKNLEGLTIVGKLLEREAGSDAALFGASKAEQVEQNAHLLGRDAKIGLEDDVVDDALLSKLEAVTALSGASVGASTEEAAMSPSLSAKKANLGDLLAGTGDGEGLDLVGNEADFDFDSYINSAAEESNDSGGLFG